MTWWRRVREIDVRVVAPILGLERRGRSWGPCPGCGAEKRSRSDRRAPVSIRDDGAVFRCWCCDAAGTSLDLVCIRLAGERWRPGVECVEEWFADHGFLDGDARVATPPRVARPAPLRRVPRAELASMWDASTSRALPADVLGFLSSRTDLAAHGLSMADEVALARLDVVRALPDRRCYQWPEWWPARWASIYRLAILCFDARGEAAGLHARAVRATKNGKTRWCRGYAASRLLMPGIGGLDLLRGCDVPMHAGVWICEGVTDVLAASIVALQLQIPAVVLGAASGGFQALADVRWPRAILRGDVAVYIRSDDDEAGNRYAEQAHRALYPLGIAARRAPWETT